MSTKLTFSKNHRLLTSGDFRQVFDYPIQKIHTQHLLVFVGQGQQGSRLGLAITKKKLKTAVARNHLKRLTREYFRQHCQQLSDVDVVLMVKTPFDKTVDIHVQLSHIFTKLSAMYPVSL